MLSNARALFALHHFPLFMDGTWLLLVPVKTAVGLQPANKVCSDSTRNEQVETSVCRINFDGIVLPT